MRPAHCADPRSRSLAYGAVLLACAVPLLWAAWFEHGVFWPDEIFQTLEQGHRFAFGYGLIPWEFRDGVRSWAFPGALGIVMKAGAWAGIRSGLGLARLVKLCIAGGTVLGCYATMRIAERLSRRLAGDGDPAIEAAPPQEGAPCYRHAALLAGGLYASSPFLVYFGSRCFTDTASIPLVAFGTLRLFAVTEGDARARRSAAVAGLLLGIAVVVRYQNALFLGAALGVVAATRSWKSLGAFAAGALVALAAGAALDWATWGAPFAPLLRYARRVSGTHVPGELAGPADYYAKMAWRGLGWPSLLLLVGVAASAKRSREPLVLAGVFIGVHCLLANKQVRFLLPALPLVLAMAAAGLVAVVRSATRGTTTLRAAGIGGLALAVVVTSAFKLANATFETMGREGVTASAWHNQQDPTETLSLAGGAADLCGVMFGVGDWGYTGVYSYLHRNVPLFHGVDSSNVASANYIVAARGARIPAGYDQVMTHDTYAVYRREGSCAAPASYSWNSER